MESGKPHSRLSVSESLCNLSYSFQILSQKKLNFYKQETSNMRPNSLQMTSFNVPTNILFMNQ